MSGNRRKNENSNGILLTIVPIKERPFKRRKKKREIKFYEMFPRLASDQNTE